MKYIYSDKESRSLEFKSRLPNFSSLIKTCVAFANGTGGKIIIGVEGKSKEIVGIDDKSRDRVYDEFPNSLYDATSPSLLAEIYEKHFGHTSIIIIEVPSSIKKPVFIKKQGIPKGVYLRAGSNTRQANEAHIQELIRKNKRIRFDEEIIQADIHILSKALLKNTFSNTRIPQLLAEKIITRLSSNSKKYSPTVAGTLMFCDKPDLYIKEAVVLCTRFNGIDSRNIIQSEEISGHLKKQIESSFQLIKSWMIRDYQFSGAKLKGEPIIPEVALREAITNALIHRKYWIPSSTKIALYDNRLEIINPGNFPKLINLNYLGNGTTYLRNPVLAKLAKRQGFIEKRGTGIRLILDSCNQVEIKKPEFIEDADSVKVVFSFLPSEENHFSINEKLVHLFNMHDQVKFAEVEKYLGVSRNTATRKLNQLIDVGKVQRIGKGPAVKYITVKSIDLKEGAKILGRDEISAGKILAELVNTFQEVKKDIEEACRENNLKMLQGIVHKFYGGVCYVGVPYLRNISKELETALRNNVSRPYIDKLCQRLLNEIIVVKEKFRTLFLQ